MVIEEDMELYLTATAGSKFHRFAVGVFDGGNDFPTSAKLLTFESDRNAFRFSSGSVQNPKGQQIQFKLTQNNLTGSTLFESSAFDTDGNYLNPSDYTQYPGKLTSLSICEVNSSYQPFLRITPITQEGISYENCLSDLYFNEDSI